MRKCHVLCILILVLILNSILAHVNILKIACGHDNVICMQPTCSMSKNKRNYMTLLDVGCFFPKLTDNITARVTLFRKRGKHYERYFVEADENFCEVIGNAAKNRLIAYIFREPLAYLTNIHCPLVGNVVATKVPLQLNMVPGMFPDSTYLLSVVLRAEETSFLVTNLTFKIV